MNLRHDAERGAWYDGTRRYLVLRPDSLMGALRSLDAVTRELVFDALASSLQSHGGDSLRAYAARVNGDAETLIDATVDAARDLGWGQWTVHNDAAVLDVVVQHSPFAAGWLAAQGSARERPQGRAAPSPLPAGVKEPSGGRTFPCERPKDAALRRPSPVGIEQSGKATFAQEAQPAVCAPIRGMVAALAETLGDAAPYAEELSCAAQGHIECRFRVTRARTLTP